MLESRLSPPVSSFTLASRKGVVALAVDALGVGLGDGLVDGPVDHLVVHGELLGDGVGHQHAAPEAQIQGGPEGRGELRGGVSTR